MTKSVSPSTISGTVRAPASKSMLQRAVAAALLSRGTVRILNPTYSNDARAALSIAQTLGAQVEANADHISITGGMKPRGKLLNCGEAGLSIRMFTPIAALNARAITLTGEGSLIVRPVSMMEDTLKQLGVTVRTNQGLPPITVTGPIAGGSAEVDGSVSSQFLTGLLMALPLAQNDSTLTVRNLKSTPYIDMTLALLKDFGVTVEHRNHEIFNIRGNQAYVLSGDRRRDGYHVEGDWSGASFLLTAGAVGGKVRVTGLDPRSPQADRRILDALTAAGADVHISDEAVTVTKRQLSGFSFDAEHCPDLFPPLVALACNCAGTTVLTGVERLLHKESNRAEALQKEFSALGAKIHFHGNRMEIQGSPLSGGSIDSHNDHRIAMAGALAAINATGDVTVRGPQCVAKSYPRFFEDLYTIGGVVHE